MKFDSEEAVAEHLRVESGDARYLYRGQSREYRRRWPLTDGPFRHLSDKDLVDVRCWRFEPASLELPIPLVRGTMDLPSLIPTNTRTYERYLEGAGHDWEENAFEDVMVYFWTAVCAFLVGLACRICRDSNGLEWLETQWKMDFPGLYKLRSIGQHYGLDTGLLDATTSIHVGLWFATHDFNSGSYRTDDSAVLYQIDRSRLRDVERWLQELPEHEGEFDATSVDIRDTPATVAPRALRQEGWSLVGWDHPRLITRMVAEGGLIRYDFPTASAPSAANTLTRDYLVPHRDPTRILFEIFWRQEPRSLVEAQDWIDDNWNIAASQRIVLDEGGAWFRELSFEIGRIYDFHAPKLHDLLDAERHA